MLYIFRLLFLLININQKTILNWFGMEDSANIISDTIDNGSNSTISNFVSSTDVSLETFQLIVEDLWKKLQNGLTLGDIESVLFFIIFVRFIILAIRYNLKTSFSITCIGLFAGYLWYKHLIDLILMYRNVLLKIPFLHSLGIDAIQMQSLNRQMSLTEAKLEENTHWYNPIKVIYYGIANGIIHTDSDTGLQYYIDPISMFLSNLEEPYKSNSLELYYRLYSQVIPKICNMFSKFWSQLSGIAAYAVITRIGKRYCPYLVRWHWTFLLIIGLIEQVFIQFIYRVYYFQLYVLLPETVNSAGDSKLLLQVNVLNGFLSFVVLVHIGFIIFGLFHAICGQYFYVPFFVESTELHIGPRPKNSVYSGGETSWQDPEEKKKKRKRFFPKLWYGWFGKKSQSNYKLVPSIRRLMKKIFKKFRKSFR